MKYLAVKNFAEFQHYHDRTPVWIKLYNSLLDNYEFLQLTEVTQRHLMLLWLLASRHKNRIPNDPSYLKSALHAKSRIDVAAMIGAGFIEEVEQDASHPLAEPEHPASKNGAKPEQVASPRALAREEKRRVEKKQPAAPGAEPKALDLFPKAACDALHAFWISDRGAVDYGRFRKAFKPLYPPSGPVYSLEDHERGITAFGEAADADNPTYREKWNVEKYVSDVHNWVRIGRMPPFENGIPTERGRLGLRDYARTR